MSAGFIHHVRGMALRNTTRLDTLPLMRSFADAMADWSIDGLRVWVRSTRGAEYSGTCYPRDGRIFVNLSPRLQFPYTLQTQVARGKTRNRVWRRALWTLEIANLEQLALFIFLHECYHWLLHRAKQNERCKEAMCDRFATRYLVDECGLRLRDDKGHQPARSDWDMQDLDGFVSRAPKEKQAGVTPITTGRIKAATKVMHGK